MFFHVPFSGADAAVFLSASSSKHTLLSMFSFSGRGMALFILPLFSAMLPSLSVSAYNTSAGNDCLSLMQHLQLSVTK